MAALLFLSVLILLPGVLLADPTTAAATTGGTGAPVTNASTPAGNTSSTAKPAASYKVPTCMKSNGTNTTSVYISENLHTVTKYKLMANMTYHFTIFTTPVINETTQTVMCSKDNGTLPDNICISYKETTAMDDENFIINMAKKADAGVYSCAAMINNATQTATFTLTGAGPATSSILALLGLLASLLLNARL